MEDVIIIERLLSYLRDDLGYGDITTDSIIGESDAEAVILAKEAGVLAGMEEALLLLEHFGLCFSQKRDDGKAFEKGEVLLEISGRAKSILNIERVLLNIFMKMSGIATTTKRAVEIADRYGVRVACTRKTTPGFGYFEKKAVKLGGGLTHRFHLDDLILIKDNHLVLVELEGAIARAKENFTKKVEVEVASAEEAVKACNAGADIVMLDNFTPEQVEHALLLINQSGHDVTVEVSGGITIENLNSYAKLKPDIISLSYITTAARWIDMSLKLGKLQSLQGGIPHN